jgi:hypothetical protein
MNMSTKVANLATPYKIQQIIKNVDSGIVALGLGLL